MKTISPIRVIAAFLLAPLTPCVILTFVAGNAFWFLVFAPFCYLIAVAGVPVFFLFNRFGWLRLWQVVAAGVVLGGVAAIAGGFAQASSSNMLQLIGYGALSALVFWLVAFAGQRPNNSFKPMPLRGTA